MSERSQNVGGLVTEVDAPRDVVDEFRCGFHVKMALAAARNARIQAENERLESRLIDGLGQLVARVDADVFFAMRFRFGPDCWKDKDFLDDCVRKGMIRKVRGRADKTTLLVNGRKAQRLQGGEVASRQPHTLKVAGSIPAPATAERRVVPG